MPGRRIPSRASAADDPAQCPWAKPRLCTSTLPMPQTPHKEYGSEARVPCALIEVMPNAVAAPRVNTRLSHSKIWCDVILCWAGGLWASCRRRTVAIRAKEPRPDQQREVRHELSARRNDSAFSALADVRRRG